TRGAPPTARRTVHAQVWSRPSVALVASATLHQEVGAGAIPLLERTHRPFYAARILGVAAKARAFLIDHGAVRAEDAPVPLHEAPLARELVYPDAPIGVVSDRIYRLFGPLRKYEDVQVARAEIAAEMRDGVYAREPGDDAPWVLDLVAWALAREWQRQALHLRDPREFVKPFGFIPSVDIVLHRPDFPFAAEFYDNFYYTDFLRDDVARFNHDLAAGKIVWEKLVDREGAAKAGDILDAYLAGGEKGGFRAVAERVTGENLSAFFAQWRAPLPRVNYRLVRVKDAQEKDGTWTSEITVAREGAPVEEPVPVRLTVPEGYRWGTWNSAEGEQGTIRVSTPVRPRSWIIDPNARLYQTSLRDDRIPPTWQGLLQYAYVDYDFKLKRVDGAAGVTFERTNDLRNEIIADGFFNPHSTGADVGFSHSAGPFSYYRGLMHRYGFLLIGEHLDRSFGKNGLHVVPGFDPSVSNVRDTSSLQVFYRYDSRDDWRFPRTGTRFLALAEGGVSVVGRASSFEEIDAQAVQLVPLTDNNVFAVAAKAGTFLGNDARSVPLSKLFSLGGIDDVRGISPPEVVGPARFLGAGEWRHYALHDQDWNLWLVRVRGIQGALFADGGYISAHPGNVPPVTDWVVSAGYGLRVMYDFLGVRPQVFRIEMAQRVDDQQFVHFHPDWRLYIG
ncbi:MAG TPA: BamA/TamA family outer membrane protein, partial [bacterium]|nr:BamA/TamA family outer membrane protein [bacterium]